MRTPGVLEILLSRRAKNLELWAVFFVAVPCAIHVRKICGREAQSVFW